MKNNIEDIIDAMETGAFLFVIVVGALTMVAILGGSMLMIMSNVL